MPTYEYKCTNCGLKTEIFHKISDQPQVECPTCHQKTLHRGVGGGIGIVFKGSGFYATDYGSKSVNPEIKSSESEKPLDKPSNKSSGCCPCGKNNTSCSSQS